MYYTRAIITRGLYIFYPILQDHFFVFKEVFFRKFSPYVWLIFKSSFYSRAVSNQERLMIAQVRYIQKPLLGRYFPERLNYRITGVLIFSKIV